MGLIYDPTVCTAVRLPNPGPDTSLRNNVLNSAVATLLLLPLLLVLPTTAASTAAAADG